ncbi:MAG: hypothetical protein AMXMBFR4_29240 [Candidatus Hydrogenedentota bacterium]
MAGAVRGGRGTASEGIHGVVFFFEPDGAKAAPAAEVRQKWNTPPGLARRRGPFSLSPKF